MSAASTKSKTKKPKETGYDLKVKAALSLSKMPDSKVDEAKILLQMLKILNEELDEKNAVNEAEIVELRDVLLQWLSMIEL